MTFRPRVTTLLQTTNQHVIPTPPEKKIMDHSEFHARRKRTTHLDLYSVSVLQIICVFIINGYLISVKL